MSIILELIFLSVIIIIISILLLSSIIISCFKVEDIPDGLSVSSEGSSKSKEYTKSYITKMNTYINKYMKFELPELNLKTYLKETKKYRNNFPILCNISNFKHEKIKNFNNKKVTFQEEIEIEEKIF